MITYSDFQKAERKYKNVLAVRGHSILNQISSQGWEMRKYTDRVRSFHVMTNPGGIFDLLDNIPLERCKGYHKEIKRFYKLMLAETSRIITDELPIKSALDHKQYAEQIDRGCDPNDTQWRPRNGMKVGETVLWTGKAYAKILWI